MNQYDSAMLYYRQGLLNAQMNHSTDGIQNGALALGKAELKLGLAESALEHLKYALQNSVNIKNYPLIRDAGELLNAFYFSKGDLKNAYYYSGIANAAKDSVSGVNKLRQIQSYQIEEVIKQQQKLQEVERSRIQAENKYKSNSLMGLLGSFIVISSILFYNFQRKKSANQKLAIQNRETEIQKLKVEQTLSRLQSTQAQLIHAEKMASLGELTAGIAHEIQNPLNFVNNFSDLNKEMLEEMKEELANSTSTGLSAEQCQLTISIANDLIDNESKINHHGKRAESIVKGMLEHSRKSTGVKEPIDINKLCEEFVRLSYQGLRAKDKSFNCDYRLDLDLPLVNVISQDIGRVIMNIVNNAFQATEQRITGEVEKGRRGTEASGLHSSKSPFLPLVKVATKNFSNKIEIRISDNGPGIPDTIKDKIFQPFFTTKPTGQGTGLGLSLAYDIVKAHGGSIEVKSVVEEGTEFIFQLPIL